MQWQLCAQKFLSTIKKLMVLTMLKSECIITMIPGLVNRTLDDYRTEVNYINALTMAHMVREKPESVSLLKSSSTDKPQSFNCCK